MEDLCGRNGSIFYRGCGDMPITDNVFGAVVRRYLPAQIRCAQRLILGGTIIKRGINPDPLTLCRIPIFVIHYILDCEFFCRVGGCFDLWLVIQEWRIDSYQREGNTR